MSTLIAAIDSREAQRGSRQFNRAVDSMSVRARMGGTALAGFQDRLRRLGGKMRLVRGALMSLVGGFGALMAIRRTVATIATFEKTMADLAGVTGANADQLMRLSDAARYSAAATEHGAAEAAQSLIGLSHAGFSVNQSLAILPATLDLATASTLELGDAGDVLGMVLRQFGIDASGASRAGDTLINTARLARVDLRELGRAMEYVGFFASDLGMDLDETAAALGIMSKAGIPAVRTGRYLLSILTELSRGTPKTTAVLEKFGLTLSDIDPKANKLVDIFRTLRDRGMDSAEMMEIFGRQGGVAAIALLRLTEELDDFTEANKQSEDVMRRNADLMRETLGGAIDGLISVLEEAMLKIGDEGLAGSLKGFIDTLAIAVRMLAGMEVVVDENTQRAERLARIIKVLGYVFAALIALKVGAFFLDIAASLGISLIPLLIKALPLIVGIGVAMAGWEVGTAIRNVDWIANAMDGFIVGLMKWYVRLKASWEGLPLIFEFVWDKIIGAANWAYEQLLTGLEWFLSQLEGLPLGVGRVMSDAAAAIRNELRRITDTQDENIQQLIANEVRWLNMWVRCKEHAVENAEEMGDEIDSRLKIIDGYIEESTNRLKELNEKAANSVANRADRIIYEMNKELEYWDDYYSSMVNLREVEAKAREAGLETQDRSWSIQRSINTAIEAMKKSLGDVLDVQYKIVEEYTIVEDSQEDTNDAVDRMRAALSEVNLLLNDTDSLFDGIEDKTGKVSDNIEKQTWWQDLVQQSSSRAVGNFTDMLVNIDKLYNGTMKWSDAFDSLLRDIARVTVQLLIMKPLMDAVEGWATPTPTATGPELGTVGQTMFPGLAGGSAKGNVFDRSGLKAFARGGIVNSPTYFPISGGKTGLMGESGPEAIMPLKRGADGRLGVEGGQVVHQTLNFNFPNATDPNQFRRTSGQVAKRMRRLAQQ